MNAYQERMMTDVYNYIKENGPSYSATIAYGLNDHYNGNLNSVRVSQICRMLRGQGLVEMTRDNRGKAGQWVAVA